jgi:hypothetical protein
MLTGPRGQAIMDKIRNGEVLDDQDIGYLKGLQSTFPPTGLNSAAIDAALLENKSIQNQQEILDQLANLAGGGGITIAPGNPGFPPTNLFPPQPSLVFPVEPGVPGGPGLVTSISPPAINVTGEGGLGDILSSAGGEEVNAQTVLDATSPLQTTRYLRVANGTSEPVTVWVQYETEGDDGKWAWYPAAPGDPSQALRFDLQPDERTDLADNGWRINASRVRFWARSQTGQEWLKFKDQDFWLVPEKEEGQDGYYAPALETVNLVIR